MCGIAGIINLDRNHRVDLDTLLAMRDTMIHRGPDGAGLIIRGRAGLAHRRLSIIDPDGGHQPMSTEGERCWISYNGEIYNYKTLRKTLQKIGFEFITDSDTEVVLHAYQAYGEDCVEHLDGMFAFAIWDAEQEKLFLARDRLGIKPLYYSVTESQIVFASEIKAIRSRGLSGEIFNRSILGEYLANRYVAGTSTFFNGISKLLPGHTLSWSERDSFRHRHYWQPPATSETGHTRADHVNDIRAALENAVKSHLVSDVPVGLFLSGGLDSSVLAGLMAPLTEEPVHTFSIGFAETEANELDYARQVAGLIKSKHKQTVVSPDAFFKALPYMIWHEDEPIAFTSSIPLHFLSKMASDDVKVVLTGEGADELFIGYDYRYRATVFNQRCVSWYNKISSVALRKRIATAVSSLPANLRRYAERSFLVMDSSPRDLFCENFSVFRQQLRGNLLQADDDFRYPDPHAQSIKSFADPNEDIIQSMSRADLQTYLVELLMKQDQMSMSASLESRVPFLDHHLVELVSKIPARFKLQGGRTKSLLRDAVTDIVPENILTRKKMGFPVPLSGWLRGPYWPVVEHFVIGHRALVRGYFDTAELFRIAHEHRLGMADHGERLWLLINLEIWQRLYVDGEEPSQIFSHQRTLQFESLPVVSKRSLALG